jgi:hypothetical protein
MSQSKLTFAEIIDILKKNVANVDKFATEDWAMPPADFEIPEPYKTQREENFAFYNTPYQDRKDKIAPKVDWQAIGDFWLNSIGLGEYEEVDQYGGEGQGDTWYSVKYFKQHDVYIRVDGYYQSYDGVDFYNGWESCKEVKPVIKTITAYE